MADRVRCPMMLFRPADANPTCLLDAGHDGPHRFPPSVHQVLLSASAGEVLLKLAHAATKTHTPVEAGAIQELADSLSAHRIALHLSGGAA